MFAEDFQERPYWWDAAEPALRETALPATCDVAIVGGGYTGLSAAITLARLGRQVVVLDAERIGWGASSRNGGMVSGTPKPSLAELTARFGAETAMAISQAITQAFPFLEELIAREGIDCDYVRCGRFVTAWGPGSYRRLEAGVDAVVARTGFSARMLPCDRQREALGTDFYHGGMLTDAVGSLHPGKLARGLAQVAEQAGVTLVDRTRVDGISPGYTLATSRGPLAARQVLVATNGYSTMPDGTQALPFLARRMVPVASFIIATEPLSYGLIDRLFPGRRMITETRRVTNYYRPSPDGTRVLWGGRASFGRTTAREAAPTLYHRMLSVFPELEDIRISHAWLGNVSFSFDFVPHLGVKDGVHYAAGCQGSGVAVMSWLGHNAALKMAGAANAPFALDGLHFPTAPLYRGDPSVVLPAIGSWFRLRDWIDRFA